jgi:hypothetical protein
MSLVFAQGPPLPPPPPAPAWMGLVHTMTGSNGSMMDLSRPELGYILIEADLTGLSAPEYEVYRSSGPASAGSRYRGARTKERTVELSIIVSDDVNTAGFLEKDRWFWDLVGDPSEPVVWRVQTPDGEWRELTMRFEADASGGYPRDPLYDGWSLYQLRFTADDPYWYGPPIPRQWIAGEVEDFFIAAPTGDDMFFISDALTTGSVEMPNPGDVDAWVTWTAVGALSNMNFTLKAEGKSDGSLGLPDVETGTTLVTDTDPRVATALLTDGPTVTDIIEQVDPWDPRPIPKRGSQSLEVSVAIEGDGSLTATIRPRHRRAW